MTDKMMFDDQGVAYNNNDDDGDDYDDYDDDDDDRHRRSYTHAGGPSPPLHLVRFPNPVLLVCYWTSMYTHLSIVYYLYILISSFHCTP